MISAENFITEIDRGRYRYNGLGTTAIGTSSDAGATGKLRLYRKMGCAGFVAERNSGHAMDGDKVKVQLFCQTQGR